MRATELLNLAVSSRFSSNLDYLRGFKGSKIGSSDCNKYIPLFAIIAHELVSLNTEPPTSIIEYTTPTLPSNIPSHPISQYSQLFSYLTNTYSICAFKFLVAGAPEYVYIHKGMLLDCNGEILMCLGLETDYVMNTSIDTIRLSPQLDKVLIFVSNDFCNNTKYKNMKKKLESIYIGPALELGVDILQTMTVDKWLFKNNLGALKFRTVVQQQKFLKEEVPQEMIEML